MRPMSTPQRRPGHSFRAGGRGARLLDGADPGRRQEQRAVKKIHFEPNVPGEIGDIPQRTAMTILEAIHRYAETGAGCVKPLSGDFEAAFAPATTASSRETNHFAASPHTWQEVLRLSTTER